MLKNKKGAWGLLSVKNYNKKECKKRNLARSSYYQSFWRVSRDVKVDLAAVQN